MAFYTLTKHDSLLAKYGSNFRIPYEELLQTIEWHNKRNIVLKRDRHSCQTCGKQATESFKLRNTNMPFFSIGENKLVVVNNKEGKQELQFLPTLTYFDKPYYLHVHHHYYILDTLPWEYENDALVTLCNWCHWEFHENYKVPLYETDEKLVTLEYLPCLRCHGTGGFPEFSHVQGGVCFRCLGKRYEVGRNTGRQ